MSGLLPRRWAPLSGDEVLFVLDCSTHGHLTRGDRDNLKRRVARSQGGGTRPQGAAFGADVIDQHNPRYLSDRIVDH